MHTLWIIIFSPYNTKKKFKLYYLALKIIVLLNNCKKIKKDIDFLIFTDIIKAIINSVDYLDGSRWLCVHILIDLATV